MHQTWGKRERFYSYSGLSLSNVHKLHLIAWGIYKVHNHFEHSEDNLELIVWHMYFIAFTVQLLCLICTHLSQAVDVTAQSGW